MKSPSFLLSIIFLLPHALTGGKTYAQAANDTLQEVRVRAVQDKTNDVKANQFAPGQKIATIDSTTQKQYQMQSLGNLLAQQTPVFVKSYGFNALSTLSFRGASAAQSAVLWNGVPIQNAALGVADVSTLPVMLLSRVSIAYGGSSALWGSGNVGGALLLENEQPVFGGKRSLAVSAGAGSYGQYMGGLEAALGGKLWCVSVKAIGQTATNDYAYTDISGRRQTQTNSALHSGSVMLDAAYETGNKSQLGLAVWYQQYDRQMPPTLFETYSVKQEQDASLRMMANWNRKKSRSEVYAKAALIKDDIRYNDSAVLLHTTATAWQGYAELGGRMDYGKYGEVLLFVPVHLAWMKVPFTGAIKYQSKQALALAYDLKLLRNRLDVAASIRDEVVDGHSELLPGANAAYRLAEWIDLRANVQRSYRVPTLNELYYYPGGNPDLKPERGWSEDAGYNVHVSKGRWMLRHDGAVYNREIKDWIVWLGGAIWTPHNIEEVHSRGAETETRATYAAGKWLLHAGVNTAYVLSTTVSSYLPGDGSVGKQIPYVPRYNGQVNVGFTRGKLYFNYNHTYTGYRFTVSDESEYLLPYNTGNMQVMYTMGIGRHQLQLTGQSNNIWNQQYSIVGYRPMPGVNWLFAAKLLLNGPNPHPRPFSLKGEG